jgi:hypothetical protein
MTEEIILRSRIPSYEIPLISVGQFMIQKLQKIEDNTCLVSYRINLFIKYSLNSIYIVYCLH